MPFKRVVSVAAAIMLNLGFLPRSDRSVVTRPDSSVAAVLQAIDNYAISHALASIRRRGIRDAARRDRDVAEPERSGRGPRAETPRGDEATDLEMRVLFDSGELEYLAARFGTLQEALGRIEQGPPEIDGAFELGLGWLLDGIEAMIARQGGSP